MEMAKMEMAVEIAKVAEVEVAVEIAKVAEVDMEIAKGYELLATRKVFNLFIEHNSVNSMLSDRGHVAKYLCLECFNRLNQH
ncbi:hypothetical protein EMCRGX_G033837 [Ephydatia muelleri]|eukprot:Em0022g393a